MRADTEHHYLSGFRPTGRLHLGNYLGAIKPLLAHKDCATAFIADLHCQDTPETKSIAQKQKEQLRALGLITVLESDFKNPILAMAHKMSFHATTGHLSRMTQYKDKSATETATLSLFAYPVLMAADIFFFKAHRVVVGADQKQHIEYARDLFDIIKPDCPKPEAHITGCAKVYDLKEPTKKMSKSNGNEDGVIYLDDSQDDIARKVRKATAATEYHDTTAGADNLKNLLITFGGDPAQHTRFGSLKTELTDRIITELKIK